MSHERLSLVTSGPHPDKRSMEYETLVSNIAGIASRMIEIHAKDVPTSTLPNGYYENERAKRMAQQNELTCAVIEKLSENLPQEGQMR